jgi:hypothetical protein
MSAESPLISQSSSEAPGLELEQLAQLAKIDPISEAWSDSTGKEGGSTVDVVSDRALQTRSATDEHAGFRYVLSKEQRRTFNFLVQAAGQAIDEPQLQQYLESQAAATENVRAANLELSTLKNVLNSIADKAPVIVSNSHRTDSGRRKFYWWINPKTIITDHRIPESPEEFQDNSGPVISNVTIPERTLVPAQAAAPVVEIAPLPDLFRPARRPAPPKRHLTAWPVVELEDQPLPTEKPRLPIQIVQELSIEERAAVYTAHCIGWLFTDRMLNEGWHQPDKVYAEFGVENREQLIMYVQAEIMPGVRKEVARTKWREGGVTIDGLSAAMKTMLAS